MGCYVEVEDKRSWLLENCQGYYDTQFPEYDKIATKQNLPVVLVDNGLFFAAGIAFDKKEYEIFTSPKDNRPKECFIVPIEKLKKVSDLEEKLKYAQAQNKSV